VATLTAVRSHHRPLATRSPLGTALPYRLSQSQFCSGSTRRRLGTASRTRCSATPEVGIGLRLATPRPAQVAFARQPSEVPAIVLPCGQCDLPRFGGLERVLDELLPHGCLLGILGCGTGGARPVASLAQRSRTSPAGRRRTSRSPRWPAPPPKLNAPSPPRLAESRTCRPNCSRKPRRPLQSATSQLANRG
jgi:hypothetical protein